MAERTVIYDIHDCCAPPTATSRVRACYGFFARADRSGATSRAADTVARPAMSTSDLSDVETAREARAESGRAACARVLATQRDYYRVLELPRAASAADVKKAYRNLARVLHPDKCDDPRATDAMAIVTSAHSTLTTPALRAAYDLYAARVDVGDANADSFGEWQSKEGAAAVHLPPWLIKAMATPVLAQLIGFLALVLLLAAAALALALALAYFVVHMAFWFACCFGCCGSCWPRYGMGARVHAKRQARFTEMLKDYERAAMEASARGDEGPAPTVFFAQWNVDHPEPDWVELIREEDRAEAAARASPAYGAT